VCIGECCPEPDQRRGAEQADEQRGGDADFRPVAVANTETGDRRTAQAQPDRHGPAPGAFAAGGEQSGQPTADGERHLVQRADKVGDVLHRSEVGQRRTQDRVEKTERQ
jgi:hypothetical protein